MCIRRAGEEAVLGRSRTLLDIYEGEHLYKILRTTKQKGANYQLFSNKRSPLEHSFQLEIYIRLLICTKTHIYKFEQSIQIENDFPNYQLAIQQSRKFYFLTQQLMPLNSDRTRNTTHIFVNSTHANLIYLAQVRKGLVEKHIGNAVINNIPHVGSYFRHFIEVQILCWRIESAREAQLRMLQADQTY